jgi:hypothetical protein
MPSSRFPKPVKAMLRADVRACLTRCHQKLPVLAERNPHALFTIEASIDGWTPDPPQGGGTESTTDEEQPNQSLVHWWRRKTSA